MVRTSFPASSPDSRRRPRHIDTLCRAARKEQRMSTSSPAVRPAVSPLPDIVGLGGAVAGLGGGLAMMVVGAIISVSLGGDIWLESKQIASVVFGPAAVAQPGFVAGPVIVGTLLHLL